MSDALTFEKLQAAVAKIKAAPMCLVHTHLVHPGRLADKRVRWIWCVECGMRLDKRHPR